jgi:hypothetical protein
MSRIGATLFLVAFVACSSKAPTHHAAAIDKDALASRVTSEMQTYLDTHGDAGAGAITIAFSQIIPNPSRGPVLLIHVGEVDTSRTSAEAAAVGVLLAESEAAKAHQGPLSQIGVIWSGFKESTGTTAWSKIADLAAFANGSITADQLRQRTIFE